MTSFTVVVRAADGTRSEGEARVTAAAAAAGVLLELEGGATYECCAAAQVLPSVWVVCFGVGRQQDVHAPDLGWPLCMGLYPSGSLVLAAFGAAAPPPDAPLGAFYLHWPPATHGSLVPMHLSLAGWAKALESMRPPVAQASWLAANFDAQWQGVEAGATAGTAAVPEAGEAAVQDAAAADDVECPSIRELVAEAKRLKLSANKREKAAAKAAAAKAAAAKAAAAAAAAARAAQEAEEDDSDDEEDYDSDEDEEDYDSDEEEEDYDSEEEEEEEEEDLTTAGAVAAETPGRVAAPGSDEDAEEEEEEEDEDAEEEEEEEEDPEEEEEEPEEETEEEEEDEDEERDEEELDDADAEEEEEPAEPKPVLLSGRRQAAPAIRSNGALRQ